MINQLKGQLIEVDVDSATMDVNGVGYELHCSSTTLGDLTVLLGKEILIHTYTHVREDVLQLFGFLSKMEKAMFLSLLKVNGVGPKMALSILSGGRVEQIQNLIESGDAKGLSALPKVGKKTAEQIVLTLQGKLVKIETASTKAKFKSNSQRDISSALVNLGFKPQIVEEFVASLPNQVTVEEGVRQGLQSLTQGAHL